MGKDIALGLADTAAELNKMHGDIEISARKTLESVYEIAAKLYEVKESVPHGEFETWIDENLFFSVRTAQNYMSAFRRKDLISEAGAEQLSQAYAAIKAPKEKEVVVEEIDIDVDPEAEYITPDYDYWPLISAAGDSLKKAYGILGNQRTQDTPISLSNFIGNLYEMYCRLDLWSPDLLEDCTECAGKGFTVIQKDGLPVEVKCPICIRGKLGPYKESDY